MRNIRLTFDLHLQFLNKINKLINDFKYIYKCTIHLFDHVYCKLEHVQFKYKRNYVILCCLTVVPKCEL